MLQAKVGYHHVAWPYPVRYMRESARLDDHPRLDNRPEAMAVSGMARRPRYRFTGTRIGCGVAHSLAMRLSTLQLP